MHENAKPQIIVIENESLKKLVAKLEVKIRECKLKAILTKNV